MRDRMKSHGLPPWLVEAMVGFVPIVMDGVTTGFRVYFHGDHPELAAYGLHVKLIPADQTQTHDFETAVDIEADPMQSNYYLG